MQTLCESRLYWNATVLQYEVITKNRNYLEITEKQIFHLVKKTFLYFIWKVVLDVFRWKLLNHFLMAYNLFSPSTKSCLLYSHVQSIIINPTVQQSISILHFPKFWVFKEGDEKYLRWRECEEMKPEKRIATFITMAFRVSLDSGATAFILWRDENHRYRVIHRNAFRKHFLNMAVSMNICRMFKLFIRCFYNNTAINFLVLWKEPNILKTYQAKIHNWLCQTFNKWSPLLEHSNVTSRLQITSFRNFLRTFNLQRILKITFTDTVSWNEEW